MHVEWERQVCSCPFLKQAKLNLEVKKMKMRQLKEELTSISVKAAVRHAECSYKGGE
jgi:hypothetical protein